MATRKVKSSRSASPAASTISTMSSAQSTVSSWSSAPSTSSLAPGRTQMVILSRQSKPHFVFIGNLPPHNHNKQAVFNIIRRFLPRLPITQLTSISEGVVVQSPIPIKQQLTSIIGAAQFGPRAIITSKIPVSSQTMMSVIIRGVDVTLSEKEIKEELLGQKFDIHRVMRIKNDKGPTFMVRVLSPDRDSVEALLHRGVMIGKKRHRVEPSFELAAATANNSS